MNKVAVSLFILFCITVTLAYSQEDSTRYTPFTKGRSLVAMNGKISSALDNKATQFNNEKVLNNYLVEARLAKIIARNTGLGLTFSTEKYSSQQLIKIDTEVLALGPWFTYYFTNGQAGGLFLRASCLFINYYEKNLFIAIAPPIDEYINGKGIAGSVGFGYTYVMFDRVGLEASMNYRQARIFGEVTETTRMSERKEVFNRIDITFKFGFVVLFNKIKND